MDTLIEKKLEKLSGTAISDAQKLRDKIEKELEEERKTRITSKEDEFLANAYMEIQKNISQIQKEDNEKVLHADMAARKELLLKREAIIDRVFLEAEKRIEEYVKTDAYKESLKEKIKSAISELGEGRKVVYLTEADALVFDKSLPAELELVSEEGFIGGVKVINKDTDVAVNYSYYELLNEQRAGFLHKSGLSLS